MFPNKPSKHCNSIARVLEDYAYTNTLVLTEYDKATDKMEQVLETFLESASQDSEDMEKFLTANNCVTAELWGDSADETAGEDLSPTGLQPGDSTLFAKPCVMFAVLQQ